MVIEREISRQVFLAVIIFFNGATSTSPTMNIIGGVKHPMVK